MTSVQLTPKLIQLIIESKRHGKIFTRDDIKGFNRYSWYLDTSFLKKIGIIIEVGLNDRNQKKWKLTPTGDILAEKLIEIEVIMDEINGRLKDGK